MNIVWNFSGEMITREEVIELEKKLNVKFPEDYVSQILDNNGGIPDPSQLDFNGRKSKTLGELFCINDIGSANVYKKYKSSRDVLPMSIIPIAADAGGNYYCFDYINGAVPSIVYWNHDECYPADDVTPEQLKTKPLEVWQREAITPVCNTFTELLQMLY
ncbi:unnamed protein product [marine sediment metagenome]|uniref:Knr4/Smi1-like domain-containing protein n=1 Tax=marine sediment metagenome TaxID=412755 RepID=X1SUJ7_9ZZZZ